MSPSFNTRNRGFTLTELLVSLSIVTIILTVVVRSQSGYTEQAALTQYADGIATLAAEAQSYGNAVKEVSTGSANFSAPYGFSASVLAAGDETNLIFFADLNDNTAYDGTADCATGPGEECLEKTVLERGNRVQEICTVTGSGEDCGTPKRADVSYKRPSLTPRITVFNSGGTSYAVPGLLGVRIRLVSAGGATRSALIYKSGQISVQ